MKNTYFKRISLLVVTIIFFFSCKDNDEVICEKIVTIAYNIYDDTIFSPRKSMINLVYQKGNILKQIYSGCQWYHYEDFYYGSRLHNLKVKKNTLNAFFFYTFYEEDIDGSKIDLNKEIGTVFHSEYWNDATEEEKLENGILFEAQIFDTIFNDILPVRKCNLYTSISDSNYKKIMEKWHFYYDVDRCIYVHAEARNAQTGKLLRINKVVEVSSMSPEYFEKLWVGNPTENVLIPSLCIWD